VKASARATSDADLVVLAFRAGQHVRLANEERHAALRRALLVFAAGGDLHRDPALDDPAVLELASGLDSGERRAALLEGLRALEGGERLAANPDAAWRAFACALLAVELADDSDL
jgi:hypothetical protein